MSARALLGNAEITWATLRSTPLPDHVRSMPTHEITLCLRLAGTVAAFIEAYPATRYLVRYFENRTLIPVVVYRNLAGPGSLAFFTSG